MARRSQAGTGANGTAEAAPTGVAWWRGEDFGRRNIESTMDHHGAFGNKNGGQAPCLSRHRNE